MIKSSSRYHGGQLERVVRLFFLLAIRAGGLPVSRGVRAGSSCVLFPALRTAAGRSVCGSARIGRGLRRNDRAVGGIRQGWVVGIENFSGRGVSGPGFAREGMNL